MIVFLQVEATKCSNTLQGEQEAFFETLVGRFLTLSDISETNLAVFLGLHTQKGQITPQKFNIAPEKWWLEDYFPIGFR